VVLSGWTIGRATGVGISAGLAAVLLWPLYAVYQDAVLAPFLLMLCLAALCGLSILWITLLDLLTHRRRGSRLRPVRAFDLAVALLLAVPSLLQLQALLAGR
jgi:drug/metabolite transporter (DMT)-like permease